MRTIRSSSAGRFNGRAYRVTTGPSSARIRPGLVTVKSYRDTILDYATLPRAKTHSGRGDVRPHYGLTPHPTPATPTIQHIG
jgi:hypothetical protein